MAKEDDNRDYFLKTMLPQIALGDAMTLGAEKAIDRAEESAALVMRSRETKRIAVNRQANFRNAEGEYEKFDMTEYMKTLGFEFSGDLHEGDKMEDVAFPEGWSFKGTGHTMWTYILDDRGRERFSMFYKNVMGMFIEDAFVNITRRFHLKDWHDEDTFTYTEETRYDNSDYWFAGKFYVRVTDAGIPPPSGREQTDADKIRKTFGPYVYEGYEQGTEVPSGEPYRKMSAQGDSFQDEAKAWLNENYPNWRDPRAHWDAE